MFPVQANFTASKAVHRRKERSRALTWRKSSKVAQSSLRAATIKEQRKRRLFSCSSYFLNCELIRKLKGIRRIKRGWWNSHLDVYYFWSPGSWLSQVRKILVLLISIKIIYRRRTHNLLYKWNNFWHKPVNCLPPGIQLRQKKPGV